VSEPARRRTILLVDDEEDLLEVLTDFLITAGFQIIGARGGREALRQMERNVVDLVVLDVMMPDLSGFEVCKQIKSNRDRYLPVILLTARGDIESLVSGLGQAGADDYVVKPFKNPELVARIHAALRVKDLYELISRQNILLTELSNTDDLTGLFNRRFMTRALNERIEKLKSGDGVLTCALLDLNNFKQINDSHGHLAGDEVLRKFSELMKASLDSNDICGRWGGDEFLIIFREIGSHPEKIAARAEAAVQDWVRQKVPAIVQELQKSGPPVAAASRNSGQTPGKPVSISGGAASVIGPDRSLHPVQMIADLDQLLYVAKGRGNGDILFAPFNSIGRRSAPAGRGEKAGAGRPLIFVLEDDGDICSIVRDMLARQNFETVIFQETPLFFDALKARTPNLILLDLKLADADGRDVCRHLRHQPELADTRISFLSAFTAEDIRQTAIDSGADAFIIKPFTYSKFIKQIHQLIAMPAAAK